MKKLKKYINLLLLETCSNFVGMILIWSVGVLHMLMYMEGDGADIPVTILTIASLVTGAMLIKIGFKLEISGSIDNKDKTQEE